MGAVQAFISAPLILSSVFLRVKKSLDDALKVGDSITNGQHVKDMADCGTGVSRQLQSTLSTYSGRREHRALEGQRPANCGDLTLCIAKPWTK